MNEKKELKFRICCVDCLIRHCMDVLICFDNGTSGYTREHVEQAKKDIMMTIHATPEEIESSEALNSGRSCHTLENHPGFCNCHKCREFGGKLA